MKKINFAILVLSFIAFSCGNKGTGTSDATKSSDSTATSASSDAVCIWDNISLKDAPEESGKWLCAISIGETVTNLNETDEDNSGKKPVTYVKIKLKDGKEGWAQNDFIILNSKAAAIKEKAEMYSRPDLLTKTGKAFSQMDIVAVKSEKDGFIEVSGKRKDGKWIESGWLKPNTVTYESVDIAVAKFARKAFEITDAKKQKEAIDEILNNSDLKASIFISALGSEKETPVDAVADSTAGNQ